MTDSNIQLVAIDLDGTLLDTHKRIPKETVSVIQKVMKKGVIVTLASGRAFCSVAHYARELQIPYPLITCCGSYVSDVEGKEILVNQPLNWGEGKEIVMYFEDLGYYIKLYTCDTFFVEKESEPTAVFSRDYYIPYVVVGAKNLSTLPQAPLRMMLLETPERIHYAKEKLLQWKHLVTWSTDGNSGLDIVDASVNKAAALRSICQKMNIELANVMAIGNEVNDIGILQEAGVGIAMENSVPAVKQYADAVTKSNEARGVEYALRKYVLKDI